MSWLALVALAFTLWGRGVPVVVNLTDLPPADPGTMAISYPGDPCTILIYTSTTYSLTAEWRADLMLHEAGHCLGLPHLLDIQPGVMQAHLGQHFSGFDRVLFWRRFGSAAATRQLPGLAVD